MPPPVTTAVRPSMRKSDKTVPRSSGESVIMEASVLASFTRLAVDMVGSCPTESTYSNFYRMATTNQRRDRS